MHTVHKLSVLAASITLALTATAPQAASPVGYGASVTGGGSKTAVTASTLAAIQSAIDSYSGSGGLVIKYTGTFDYTTITDVCAQHSKSVQEVAIKNKNDITIFGADGSSANFGIRIKGSSSNIIVQNMTIGLLPGGDDNGDIIGIEGTASKVWIDHNTLFSSNQECSGTGDTMFDGMIDIKADTDNITISYNYMHDHHKLMLGGSSDSDNYNRRVTLHHNWIDTVGSRTPMDRFGTYHIFNNYYNNVTVSGINVRMGGIALIEANYFENSANPVTSRDSDTIGYWDLRNNYVGTGITWDSTGVNATNWTTSKTFSATLGYTYTLDSPALVKCIAKATAGAGKSLATTSSGCGSSSSSSSSAASSASSSSSSSSSSTSSSSSSAASSSASSAPTLSGTGDYPDGFTKCAALGETCSVKSGTGWVAFGRKGSWVAKYVGVGNSIACTVAAFGSDPVGNPNKCSYQK